MSFLYPLFLLAGLTVLIPLLIHLFNLRRYKTVYFPSVRFLRSVQLHSQKQSQIRYKWLLAARILFLLFLVLAFAQPFFQSDNKKDTGNRLQIIYLDNSNSMSVKMSHRTLLDMAKEAVRTQLKNAPEGSRFILLTNEKPASYQPVSAEKALAILEQIDFTAVNKTSAQVFASVQALSGDENRQDVDLYYYSDFQSNSFMEDVRPENIGFIRFFGVPVRTTAPMNVFVDTAYLVSPVLQVGQNNNLIVKSRRVGKAQNEQPVVQLSINGQVKSAVTVNFGESDVAWDTLSFQVSNGHWQRMALTVNDAAVRFDDTFRIAAKGAANLSVLILNEKQPNPFLQAAFKTHEGFRADQQSISNKANWSDYNLIILNGITRLDENTKSQLRTALAEGQSICVFPGKTAHNQLNEVFRDLADIKVTGIDTAVQAATTLQQGSDLVRDLFERIPPNVQLPVANWHYVVEAGLSANQQSVLSFRNGDPLLAQYSPSRGKLYLLSSGADLEGGNFATSYFFVPFLYQMAAQSKGGDVFALTAGASRPVLLSLKNTGEKNMVHIRAEGLDVIPPQRPAGGGLEIFLGQVIQQPGFYTLSSDAGDSTVIAINGSREESELRLWDLDQLRSSWKGDNIFWVNKPLEIVQGQEHSGLSLWKVCVILALLLLMAETYLLAAGYRKPTVAPR